MATNSDIVVKNNLAESRFQVQLGEEFAQIAYVMEGDVMIFVHTEVPKAYGGLGIADKMAHTALDYAKAQHYRVMALCPFVSAYIQRHPEYKQITISYSG